MPEICPCEDPDRNPTPLGALDWIGYAPTMLIYMSWGGTGFTIGEIVMLVTGTPFYSDYRPGMLYSKYLEGLRKLHCGIKPW
jgi:hypothetical protein